MNAGFYGDFSYRYYCFFLQVRHNAEFVYNKIHVRRHLVPIYEVVNTETGEIHTFRNVWVQTIPADKEEVNQNHCEVEYTPAYFYALRTYQRLNCQQYEFQNTRESTNT